MRTPTHAKELEDGMQIAGIVPETDLAAVLQAAQAEAVPARQLRRQAGRVRAQGLRADGALLHR